MKKPSARKRFSSKPSRSGLVDLDDDFEANFRQFKDDFDVDEDDDLLIDVKPFGFSAIIHSKPSKSLLVLV
ncbi:ethylene-responsive transcription factor RAP2-12-like [Senna tora]|uniref:Ethylene-responsive transcription factor RAP2-12-like n=1 Tax=Senna tora TaxID=362788 RepID=A0A834STH5_9FABA|nr:ethylene-responsive transcription factor RAP2-12-like [Senna tora]